MEKNKGKKKKRSKPRVRQEWRKLAPEIKQRVADAFWTLKNTTTKVGRKQFGKHFTNWDEFLLQHACTTFDPRCDQGHFGPQFMTFHRAFLLKVELALLSVDSGIGALPYWDMSLDAVDGDYYKDAEKSIFSPSYFGAKDTKADNNYTVTDGLFAFWPIAKLEQFKSNKAECIKSGLAAKFITSCDDGSGPVYLRNTFKNCNLYLTRNPESEPNSFNIQGSLDIVYSQEDFSQCTDPTNIKSWMEWQNCIEVSDGKCNQKMGGGGSQCSSDPYLYGFYKSTETGQPVNVNFLHSQAHVKVGNDLLDTATSPNDAGFFTGHHSNVDRNNMIWQSRTESLANDLWHFPKNQNDLSGVNTPIGLSGPFSIYDVLFCNNTNFPEYDAASKYAWISGSTLHDVVGKNYPFFDLFSDYDGRPYGYTHKDILERTTPKNTPYTYDTLEYLYP